MPGWTIKDSLELYNVPYWGQGYFDVNADGHLEVRPEPALGPDSAAIDVYQLVSGLVERGVELPILIRFTDLVRARVENIVGVFNNAFEEYGYKGRYRGVYPVKVNQNRHLVEDLVRFARPHHMGLEAGSKPELLITLALLEDPDAYIICNGYKDAAYIETAILAQKLGRQTVIVVEKLSEIETIVRAATKLGVRPIIGVRAKLSRPGKGRWKTSSGDRAKFGLTVADIVELVRRLKEVDMLDCLKLLHFHIGSQVTAIRTFKEALREATRIYVELVEMGAPMGIMDCGGGLGVDYDGSRTNFESSMNYSDQEYANDVVYAVMNACDDAGLAHPDIITESGRALVAHHSMLVFDVIGVEALPTGGPPVTVGDDDPSPLRDLKEVYDKIDSRSYIEAWHDAMQAREEALQAFNLGMIGLETRARVERLFWQVCGKVRTVSRRQSYVPDDLDDIESTLADTYTCNFSIFQSAPDCWAIGQLFPVLPVHRHDEKPTRRAVLADITCDSDGKIAKFIGRREVKDVLELHSPNGKPYLLAMPLVGAYQEILGDLHNLFGDTNTVHVALDPATGEVEVEQVLEGDAIEDVLGYVQYDQKMLIKCMRASCELALKEGKINREEVRFLMEHYRQSIDSYTYLKEDPGVR